MREERKSKISQLLTNQKVLTLLGLLIIVLISLPLARNIIQRRKIDFEIKELEEEVKKVESKNNDFKRMIEYLESNQFIEEQARLNFGLKKNGEEVAVIKNNNEVAIATSLSGETIFTIPGLEKPQPLKPANNPQKWQRYFFR